MYTTFYRINNLSYTYKCTHVYSIIRQMML